MNPSSIPVQSYAAALWLQAKGLEPITAVLAKDSSGVVIFLFPVAAQTMLEDFYLAKDRLNALSNKARYSQ